MIAAALFPLVIALQVADAVAPPASVDRVRARLAHADVLRMPTTNRQTPTFRVEVRGDRYWIHQPRATDFTSPPMNPLVAPHAPDDPTSGVNPGSGGGTDVLPAIAAIRRAVQERAARKTVARALAEFCAAHDCSPR